MNFAMTFRNFKDGSLFAPRLWGRGIVGLLLAIGLAGPAFGQKKLNAVAVTAGDLGNPFFVQIGMEHRIRQRRLIRR